MHDGHRRSANVARQVRGRAPPDVKQAMTPDDSAGQRVMLTVPHRRHGDADLLALKTVRCFDGDGFVLFDTGHDHIEEAITARAQALADPDTRLFNLCRCAGPRRAAACCAVLTASPSALRPGREIAAAHRPCFRPFETSACFQDAAPASAVPHPVQRGDARSPARPRSPRRPIPQSHDPVPHRERHRPQAPLGPLPSAQPAATLRSTGETGLTQVLAPRPMKAAARSQDACASKHRKTSRAW